MGHNEDPSPYFFRTHGSVIKMIVVALYILLCSISTKHPAIDNAVDLWLPFGPCSSFTPEDANYFRAC